MLRRCRCFAVAVAASLGLAAHRAAADTTLTLAQQYLVTHGVMLSNMATSGDVFHSSTYSAAGYTMQNWENEPNYDQLGSAAWSQWVGAPSTTYDKASFMANLPGGANEPNAAPYLNNLVSLEMGDELNLNDPNVFNTEVQWFQDTRQQLPGVMLYANHYAGQVSDTTLGNFIAQAHPDFICFDEYPFTSVYEPNGSGNPNDASSYTPIGGPPNGWMSELWRYRQFGIGYNVPVAAYMQVFHSVEDYDSIVYRDPSESELHMNASVALAFNVKSLIGFQYNASSSTTLFTKPGGDTNINNGAPGTNNALYTAEQDVNRRATNLGKALAQLKPVLDLHNANDTNPPPGPASSEPNFIDGTTTGIMFLLGKNAAGTTNSVPGFAGFYNDPSSTSTLAYSDWDFQKNDPYFAGWGVTNTGNPTTGTKVNGGNPGNVIISWFNPLLDKFEGPSHAGEVYMMVVNALADPDGSSADCTQLINLDFKNIPDGNALLAGNQGIELLDPETGLLSTPTLTSVGGKFRLSLSLTGGDAVLFKFNDGAPFVGIDNQAYVPEPAALGIFAVTLLAMSRRRRM